MGRCTNLRKNDNLDEERHEEKRSAKPPEKKQGSEDSLLAYPTAINDPAVGVILNDPPNFVDKSLTTFRHRDPAQIPTDSSDGTGNQEQEIKEEKTLRGDCNFVLLEQLSIGRKTGTLRGPLIPTEV
ncbi:hypothetical protein E4U14_005398 [Claviceps sp. LM454 group G7]|nr:hypothetical protein E4U14_005398 [Claviceps sp. LM454 group G7]